MKALVIVLFTQQAYYWDEKMGEGGRLNLWQG